MQHASGVFFVRLLLLPGSGYHNCSVFHPVCARGIQLSRPSLVKKPNNCSVFGACTARKECLRSAGSAVTAASWPNCEQLFGFLTSTLLTASDSGSGRASGRGRTRTCSVSDFQTSRVQVKPPKNCEQFKKKR